jgi:hypothetical protein
VYAVPKGTAKLRLETKENGSLKILQTSTCVSARYHDIVWITFMKRQWYIQSPKTTPLNARSDPITPKPTEKKRPTAPFVQFNRHPSTHHTTQAVFLSAPPQSYPASHHVETEHLLSDQRSARPRLPRGRHSRYVLCMFLVTCPNRSKR